MCLGPADIPAEPGRPGKDNGVTDPKIELHVHLEGAIRPQLLLDIARRNSMPLPADTAAGLAALYEFTDFAHFLKIWAITTAVLRTEQDFRQVVLGYAAEAAGHGGVYLEGIFTPAEPVQRGASWDEVFSGYCDGAAAAREEYGIEVRLTPDIPRGYPQEAAELTARYAIRYRERGVVGLGLGGDEAEYPAELFEHAFQVARDGGIGSVPHAGEGAGSQSVRSCLDVLHPDRIRHGIRAVEDPGLVGELAGRGIVLDVCPISNVRTGVVASLAQHPLPVLTAAGVSCSVSTDDPAMFGTDLSTEYQAAAQLGSSARDCYQAGLRGALCDEPTRASLRRHASQAGWELS
jgi:aminodeoxyfutalosine deaminase